MFSDKTPTPLGAEEAKLFRDVCQAAGYTSPRLEERFGLLVPPPSDRLPATLSATVGGRLDQNASPFDVLAKAFFLGTAVEAETANALLPDGFVRSCLQSGLLTQDGTDYRPTAIVAPVGTALLASDLQRIEYQDEEQFVPALCDAALHLNAVAIRQRVGKTLDLCSGFALHGVLSCPHSETVVASDLNPRAAAFARFNAALNGFENLRAVTGSLFEAVKGERFNLILANPPFVISPDAVTTYRFNPIELDGFVRQMLSQAADYLEEGGILQTICEWVEVQGQDWQDRLRRWLADSGCDAWILPANRQLPASYARNTLAQTISDEAELAAQQTKWENYFQEQRVEAIQGGFLFIRRRAGKNWFDVTQLTKPIRQPIGDAIARGFSNRDLALSDDEDALLASRLTVADGLRQVETSHWKEFRWQRDSIVLHLDDGLPVSIGIDEYVRTLLEMFDGSRPVLECLDRFANQVGLAIETGRKQGTAMVRSLLKNGILVATSR